MGGVINSQREIELSRPGKEADGKEKKKNVRKGISFSAKAG